MTSALREGRGLGLWHFELLRVINTVENTIEEYLEKFPLMPIGDRK